MRKLTSSFTILFSSLLLINTSQAYADDCSSYSNKTSVHEFENGDLESQIIKEDSFELENQIKS